MTIPRAILLYWVLVQTYESQNWGYAHIHLMFVRFECIHVYDTIFRKFEPFVKVDYGPDSLIDRVGGDKEWKEWNGNNEWEFHWLKVSVGEQIALWQWVEEVKVVPLWGLVIQGGRWFSISSIHGFYICHPEGVAVYRGKSKITHCTYIVLPTLFSRSEGKQESRSYQ